MGVVVRGWIHAGVGRSVSVAVFVALVASFVPSRGAIAAQSLVLDPARGAPGTTVEAAAYGFLGGPVTFWWDNTRLLGTDPSGRVRRITFAVPSGAAVGTHTVRACAGSQCPPGAIYAEATFIVPGPTPKPTAKPTPKATTPATPRPSSSPAAATESPTASLGGVTSAPPPTSAATTQTALPGAGGGLAAPTMQAVGDPAAPGTVTVVLPWLVGGIGLLLGALLLRKLLDYAGTALLRIPRGPQTANKKQPRTTLTGLVPGDPKPTPTPAPPTKWSINSFDSGASGGPSERPPSGELLTHEATHTSQAGSVAGEKLTLTHEGFLDDAPRASPGESDVQLKGSKIKEN